MYTFRIWNKSDNIGTLTPKDVLSCNPLFSDNDVIIINYGEKIAEYGDVPTMRHNNLFPLDLTSEEVGQRYIDLKNELIKPSPFLQDKIDILEKENADLLLDSAIKDIQMKTLEKDLADLTLIVGGI